MISGGTTPKDDKPVKPSSNDIEARVRSRYVEEIKLQLGGFGVDLEIVNNDQIGKLLDIALAELNTYVNVTKYATLPYAPCIDLSECNVQTVTEVMRVKPAGVQGSYELQDAIYLSFNSVKGTMDSMQDYRNYLRTLQIKNTLRSDLSYRWDEMDKKLYISANYPQPTQITIQYIPYFTRVSDLKSSYWQDKLRRLTLAHCKVVLGRIRGKYTLNGAAYTLDADTLLSEGNAELEAIRQQLHDNNDQVLPID